MNPEMRRYVKAKRETRTSDKPDSESRMGELGMRLVQVMVPVAEELRGASSPPAKERPKTLRYAFDCMV